MWRGQLRMRYGLRLLTVDEGGAWCRIRTSRKTRHPTPRTMVTNPWINRVTVLVVMFAIYAAGYSGGRDQATLAHHNHPACNTNLKP